MDQVKAKIATIKTVMENKLLLILGSPHNLVLLANQCMKLIFTIAIASNTNIFQKNYYYSSLLSALLY